MKILLFGNIGSGKTTISKAITNKLDHWEYLAIDDFRRELSDGSLIGDSKAKSIFVKRISHDDSFQLIECTGLGRLGSSVYRRLQKYEGAVIVVILNVSLEDCLERIKERKWDIPFPENIVRGDTLVKKLDKLYRSNFLFERWALRKNTTFLQLGNRDESDFRKIMGILEVYTKSDRLTLENKA